VPQVFINGKHIGGLEDLQQWAKRQRDLAFGAFIIGDEIL